MKFDEMLKSSLEEVEKVLSTKTVVGAPIELGDNVVVPVVSIGFGFGAGEGQAPDEKGGGGGTGAGGGIRPVAFVILDKNGDVRVEAVKGGAASALENIGTAVAEAVGKGAALKKGAGSTPSQSTTPPH